MIIKKWFSIIEIVVSFTILIIIIVWTYGANDFFVNQKEENLKKLMFYRFKEYVFSVVQKWKIDNSFNVLWISNSFFIKFDNDNTINFSKDPSLEQKDIWFFYDNTDSNRFSHNIEYIWSSNLDNITLNTYKVTLDYGELTDSFYVTK